MSEVSLTGKDVIVVNGRVLRDFADGDTCKLDYPNDLSVVKTGKNGNSVISFKNDGRRTRPTTDCWHLSYETTGCWGKDAEEVKGEKKHFTFHVSLLTLFILR